MSEKVHHVSASSIAAFKACPQRYRIGYVEAIRQEIEPEPLRMGTAWHKGLEVLEMPVGTTLVGEDGGIAVTEENRLALAVEAATQVYETVPAYADATEWAVEREVIANALAAYAWLYPAESSEYETVATELAFELPLVNPETGHSTPNFVRVGKIDRIVRHKGSGRLMIQENKSTGKSIDSGSTYWDRLRKDTQSKFYIQAARDMQKTNAYAEMFAQAFKALVSGEQPTDQVIPLVSGLLHDVFHKPQTSPKKLTQAESAEFVKTGKYMGQEFAVVFEIGVEGGTLTCSVDGVQVEVTLGAATKPTKANPTPEVKFAIRETPAMYGARLFVDMTGQTEIDPEAHGPAYYFARREVAFTDDELLDFQYQVWALQRTMNEMERTGHWYENEQQCEATFKCAYCSICYNNVDVFHGQTPPGFKRLRVEEAEQTEATTG